MTELRISGFAAEYRPLDVLSQMLDSDADRKRLRHDSKTAVHKICIGITRAVSGSKDQLSALYFSGIGYCGSRFPAGNRYSGQLCVVPYLPAELTYSRIYPGDHAEKPVGSDVRLCVHQYLTRSAELRKSFKDIPASAVVYPRDQLSVGKGSRASGTELNVCFGIKLPCRKEMPHLCRPCKDMVSALDDYRTVSHLGKDKCREHTAGAEADDDRSAV